MTQLATAKPYSQLPLLSPTAGIKNKTILKKCVTTQAALTALKLKIESPQQTNYFSLQNSRISTLQEIMARTTDCIRATLASIYSHEWE